MIKYNFKQLLSDKEYKEGRKITFKEVSKQTGISRITITKISLSKNYNTNIDILRRLCLYFNCKLTDLVEFMPTEADLLQKEC